MQCRVLHVVVLAGLYSNVVLYVCQVEIKQVEHKGSSGGRGGFGGQNNPLATPPVHGMGRGGQYGQQGYMQQGNTNIDCDWW